MSDRILGLHHVTAIATDPQRNLDFYAGTLGLRLVKKTVNFDDPGTYHFYFGDGRGTPGTILTFFPWPGVRRGSRGVGQATATSFAVPPASLGFWRQRLERQGVVLEPARHRFDEEVLTLVDPDGLKLELVATEAPAAVAEWEGSTVPVEYAVRGFHSVTLEQREAEATARFLEETMGWSAGETAGPRQRFSIGGGGAGRQVDVVARPDGGYGRIAAGTVHHVAWRVEGDEEEGAWRGRLLARGHSVSPVMDRQYFHSIYFREPGGVLFEIATDPPGFGLDEELDRLGTELKLPPWLEGERGRIERELPTVALPAAGLSGVTS